MTFILIRNGDVYAPAALGTQNILVSYDRIVKIGDVTEAGLNASGVPYEVIDATDCLVLPGFIDPHEHLIGAGGEHGFRSRMPEVSLEQIVSAGITTVIGLLGTDTMTRDPLCLFAKVHQLRDEGLTAYMYTGGFELPTRTITGAVVDDLIIIDCVIGTGEIAVSDPRWIDPPLEDLAFVTAQTALGGQISGKAGITHFHIGPNENRLSLLNTLLDTYAISPKSIYTTHITRSEALMDEAIALSKRGAFVDMDTVEQNVAECIHYYLDHGGIPDQLTISSDAHTPGGSPAKFYAQFMSCVRDHALSVEKVLPFFSTNAARALKLEHKGRLEEGADADIVVLHKDTLDIAHIIARGRQFIKDGQRVVKSKQEQQLEESLP
jgi:beta-aspartyl-dipeptidase (metallo-type)